VNRSDDVALSKFLGYVLRHRPDAAGIELGPGGWVPVDQLLAGLARAGRPIDRARLETVVAGGEKRRYEIDGDRIRARYGHSVPGRIMMTAAAPPDVLFHGTSPTAWASIQARGLVPMGRQYVHLSTDIATAVQVGRRKSDAAVVLRVRAGDASRQGVRFWRGNDLTWLADAVPPQYLAESGS
jgi:putative RNA 2'-phosphotransferase